MADDTTSSGEIPDGPRRRRPPAPTIELTATEVGGAGAGATASAGEAAEEENSDSAKGGAEGSRGHEGVEPDGVPPPPPPDDLNQPSREGPWRSVVAGVAGGVLALALGGGIWFWHSRDADSRFNDRVAHLESQVRDLSSRPQPVAADPKPLDDLAARLARLEQPRPPDPGVDGRLAALDASAKAVTERVTDLDRRSDESAKALREIQDRLDAEAKSMAELSRQPAAAAGPAQAGDRAALDALGRRVAAVEAAVKSTVDRSTDLNRRAEESAKSVRELGDRLGAVARSVAELSRQASGPAAAERAELEALGRRVAAIEGTANALGESLKSLTGSLKDEIGKTAAESERGLRLAVGAVALKSAVVTGRPYAAELAAVRPLVPDAQLLDPLQPFAATGVPATAALGREFSSLVPKMLATLKTDADGGGFLERLQANAERLVRIRPIGDTPGDEPAAVIARMETRAVQGDLAAVLADLAKLPPDTRGPAEGWAKKAAARIAALDAAQKLSADALAALEPLASGQQK